MTDAHAPGKLVICGEYAVLHGAPAIAVAVDVRARARVADAAAGASRLTVADSGAWPFAWDKSGRPQWSQVPPEDQGRVLEAVAATLAARELLVSSPVDITLDTRAFRATGAGGGQDKLGLGSSAAITVALAAALLAHGGRVTADREQLAEIGFDAHRRFQKGSGSGVDVAASVHGGVVALLATPSRNEVRSLAWPKGLHWLAVWSGSSASTPEMLERFDAFRQSEPERFTRQIGELRMLAAAALSAWESANVAAVLRALADYDDALRALDEGAGIGIYTGAHGRLARVAQECGAVYKISGAGGGDFGIAFADSAAAIVRLRSTLTREGTFTLPGRAEVPGVQDDGPSIAR